jgi:hypothetical protein
MTITTSQLVDLLRPGWNAYCDALQNDKKFRAKVLREIRRDKKREALIEEAIKRVSEEEGDAFAKGFEHYRSIIQKALAIIDKGYRKDPERFYIDEELMKWEGLYDDPIINYGDCHIFLDKHQFRLFYLIAVAKGYIKPKKST